LALWIASLEPAADFNGSGTNVRCKPTQPQLRLELVCMIPEKLTNIDADELLRDRACRFWLNQDFQILKNNLTCCFPSAQLGVPESVWANVIMSCFTALTTESSTVDNVEPRRITVIGGRGRMGRFFAEQPSNAGTTLEFSEIRIGSMQMNY